MLFSQQKKGSERLNTTIISLTIVAVAIVLVVNIAMDLDSETKFLLDFYSHDLSMTMEAVQAVPGDIELFYPLEEDYIALLDPDRITLTHRVTGRTDYQTFHLLPNHTVEAGRADNYIIITKRDNIISFSGEEKAKVIGCPSHIGIASNDFSVAVRKGTADARSPFVDEHLNLFVASIETNLQLKGILETEFSPTMQLIISSRQPTDEFNYIIVKRPKGDSVQEQNYEFFYCELFKLIKEDGFSIKEEIITGNHYDIEIVISIHEEKVDAFVTGRNNFVKGVVGILAPLQQEVTP